MNSPNFFKFPRPGTSTWNKLYRHSLRKFPDEHFIYGNLSLISWSRRIRLFMFPSPGLFIRLHKSKSYFLGKIIVDLGFSDNMPGRLVDYKFLQKIFFILINHFFPVFQKQAVTAQQNIKKLKISSMNTWLILNKAQFKYLFNVYVKHRWNIFILLQHKQFPRYVTLNVAGFQYLWKFSNYLTILLNSVLRRDLGNLSFTLLLAIKRLADN